MNPTTVPAVEAFLNVFYLDISYTPNFPDFTRAYSAIEWPNLRVLKLRGMSLTDRAIPRPLLFHLWSLDVRDNLLTDQTIDMLLETCISVPLSAPSTSFPTPDESLFDFVPPYMRDPPTDEIYSRAAVVPLRPDDEKEFTTYLRTNGHLLQHHRPVLDDSDPLIRQTGLTHLYISGNKLSSLGVQTLFRRTNRLQVLDVGSVRAVPPQYYNFPYHTPLSQPNTARFLSASVALRLEILRLHHSVVTYAPTFLPSSPASQQHVSLQHLHAMETDFARDQAHYWTAFSPLENFRLRKLTLTGVPTKSFGPVLCRLREFVALCAQQERILAAARARATHHRAPEVLSGLRVLRLEFVDVTTEQRGVVVGGFSSVSGDRDADEFLSQSAGDFSFFGDEQPTVVGPVAALEASRRRVVEEAARVRGPRVIDVVAGLKEFRETAVFRWGGRLELAFPGRG
ncbi:hypothetical protein BGZ60DRAFT_376372 [Tricladium varicosporioides]|nr:hypothetical protein BGZ60DRAFT_376372 [Hymenoscyphus varicosporioides]